MVLIGDSAHELIGAIVTITNDIALKTMQYPTGSLYEPHRTQINGITKAYVELSKKLLDRVAAEELIHYLYFEFERPLSVRLGFAMSLRLPGEYRII